MIRNIIIIILILGFVAIVAFLDVPEVQSILDKRNKINVQKEEFIKEQELVARVEELSKHYEENKESVEKAEYILPSEEDIPNLIVQLEALAFEQGLILEKIEFSIIKTERDNIEGGEGAERRDSSALTFQVINININVMGSYPALKSFLKAVEENMRLMDVESIGFAAKKSEDPEQVIEIFEFNIVLNTYYQ